MNSPEPELTVVVPCYNEEGAIEQSLAQLERVLSALPPHEVLVVDDGSSDGTAAILASVAPRHPNVRVVRHPVNQGYGAALKTGIRRARGSLIAIVDADGTYPYDRLPDLLVLAREADMVVGARTGEHVEYSFLRKIPKVFLKSYMEWLAGQAIPDMNSGLRIFRKASAERFFNILPNSFSFTTTITLAMLTKRYDVRWVPINYTARIGKSKISPVRDTLRFAQLILRTGMYFAPLRVLMPVAFVLFVGFLASLGYDLFVLRNLTDKSVFLFMFSMNVAILALLADAIDKRGAG
jgi:glycosyltransferase involved in cell wall biosynthesis